MRPGAVEWLLSSPIKGFIKALAAYIASRRVLEVADIGPKVTESIEIPTPNLGGQARFSCLAPIVVLTADGKRFQTPDSPEFGRYLRQNMLRKYAALNAGSLPEDDSLSVTFDADCLQTRRGTKRIPFGNSQITGPLRPFTVRGSAELIALGYQAGFGLYNAEGFGMAASLPVS